MNTNRAYVYGFIATCLRHWQDLPEETTGKQLRNIAYVHIWRQQYGITDVGIGERLIFDGFKGGINEALTRRKNEDKNTRPLGVRDAMRTTFMVK